MLPPLSRPWKGRMPTIPLMRWMDGGLGVHPPLENMISQKLISQPLFSVFLNKRSRGGDRQGGEFVFGGINPSRYRGELKYLPLKSSGYWEISVDKMLMGDDVVSDRGGNAIVDTGTTLLVVDSNTATNVHKRIEGADK